MFGSVRHSSRSETAPAAAPKSPANHLTQLEEYLPEEAAAAQRTIASTGSYPLTALQRLALPQQHQAILAMQRTSGNVAVQRLLTGGDRAPSLGFGSGSRLIARSCACGGSPGVDGECVACRSKRTSAQRQPAEEGREPVMQRSPEGQPANATVVQRLPNEQLCRGWRQKIVQACFGGGGMHRGLETRYYDMLNDTVLYKHYRTVDNPHPTKGSWDGHVQQYLDQQAGMIRKLNAWDRGKCWEFGNIPALPAAVDGWAAQAPPARPQGAYVGGR